MKKILIIACAIMLCCVMLLPVAANNDNALSFGGTLYEMPLGIDAHELQVLFDSGELYCMVVQNSTNTNYVKIVISESPITTDEYQRNIFTPDMSEFTFQVIEYDNGVLTNGDTWESQYDTFAYSPFGMIQDFNVIYNSYEILNQGNFCDGTTCPATDINKDNICDDCGKPLTMSLRSTLFDYASAYADTYVGNETQYTYRIIVKDNDNQYRVYLSTTPAVYNATSNELTFTDGKQTIVTQQSDGTNKGDGWASLTTVSNALTMRGNIVYANYDIENFFPIPLWKEMDNLTQGEMVGVLPKLVGILTTLMVCGVGCLALLVVLKLFGKRSLISRN